MVDDSTGTGLDFEDKPLSRPEYLSAVIHLYRGEMHRALTWRQRLDTTTNWAVFTSGALLSFLYTDKDHDTHVVGILGMTLVFFMLCFEARRFRYFDVWRGRVRKLEENLYAPLLRRDLRSPIENWGFVVADDLNTPRFKISYWTAMRARLIRNYVPLFVVLFAAWTAKLLLHPPIERRIGKAGQSWSPGDPIPHEESLLQAFRDTGVGPIPWWLIVGFVAALGLFLLWIGIFCRPKHSDETLWWSNRSDESVDEIS